MIIFQFNRNEMKYIDKGCFQTRNTGILRLFQSAWESMPKEDLPEHITEMQICSTDGPFPNAPSNMYFIADTYENLSKCFPCYISHAWPEAHIPDFTKAVDDIREAAKIPPSSPKAFWIGATLTHNTRDKLMQIGDQHRDIMDTRRYVWGHSANFVSLPDHTKYKYLIEMQGGGYSGRMKLLMHAKRLLFVQDRPFWDWVAIDFKPWVHYVPVKNDLSDLVEKIKWADEHPTEVQQIIERCDEYALKYATRERAVQQVQDLIRYHLKTHKAS